MIRPRSAAVTILLLALLFFAPLLFVSEISSWSVGSSSEQHEQAEAVLEHRLRRLQNDFSTSTVPPKFTKLDRAAETQRIYRGVAEERNATAKALANPTAAWQRWLVKYNVSYSSREDADFRRQVWISNLERADKLNQLVGPEVAFGPNRFSDLTPEEFLQQYTGDAQKDSGLNVVPEDPQMLDSPVAPLLADLAAGTFLTPPGVNASTDGAVNATNATANATAGVGTGGLVPSPLAPGGGVPGTPGIPGTPGGGAVAPGGGSSLPGGLQPPNVRPGGGGASPGTTPGATPGTVPGTTPGTVPGVSPGPGGVTPGGTPGLVTPPILSPPAGPGGTTPGSPPGVTPGGMPPGGAAGGVPPPPPGLPPGITPPVVRPPTPGGIPTTPLPGTPPPGASPSPSPPPGTPPGAATPSPSPAPGAAPTPPGVTPTGAPPGVTPPLIRPPSGPLTPGVTPAAGVPPPPGVTPPPGVIRPAGRRRRQLLQLQLQQLVQQQQQQQQQQQEQQQQQQQQQQQEQQQQQQEQPQNDSVVAQQVPAAGTAQGEARPLEPEQLQQQVLPKHAEHWQHQHYQLGSGYWHVLKAMAAASRQAWQAWGLLLSRLGSRVVNSPVSHINSEPRVYQEAAVGSTPEWLLDEADDLDDATFDAVGVESGVYAGASSSSSGSGGGDTSQAWGTGGQSGRQLQQAFTMSNAVCSRQVPWLFGRDVPMVSVDWLRQGVVQAGVREQSNCSNSFAFVAAALAESTMALLGYTGSAKRISEAQLMACMPDSSCSRAGTTHVLLNSLACNGFAAAASGPNAFPISESSKAVEKPKACTAGDFNPVETGITGWSFVPPTELAFAQALSRTPIKVAVDATLLQNYRAGFIGCNVKSSVANHAILAVGYNQRVRATPLPGAVRNDPRRFAYYTGGDYWMLRNSWGNQGSVDGYVYLAKGCGAGNVAPLGLLANRGVMPFFNASQTYGVGRLQCQFPGDDPEPDCDKGLLLRLSSFCATVPEFLPLKARTNCSCSCIPV